MQLVSRVEQVFELLASGGGTAYFGEPVTVLEHSLQTAWFASKHDGDKALVAAALLHDLGHLLHVEGEDAANRGMDTHHETLAAQALEGHLPAAVLDAIRLHVAAKRYLCHADTSYAAGLSPASRQSLDLQGGPMTVKEAEAFLALPHAAAAIAFRHADDAAKAPGLVIPQLESYRSLVASLWR